MWAFCHLFLLFWFPACGASCQFHCTGFPLRSAFTTWAFTKLGFGCTWPPPCGDQARVVSARLHPSHGIRYVGGVCNFLGSVSLQQKFEMADQCYSSLTAQFYSQAKEGTPSRLTEGGLTPKERPQSILASSFYTFVFSSPWLYANWTGQEGGVFVSPEVLTPVCGFSFLPFSWAFPFLCLLATTILDYFFLF